MLSVLLLALAADFQSIDLHGGGQVILRYASVQEVRFVEGDAGHTPIRIAGGHLVIDHCPDGCPRGYRMVVEVATPGIAALTVNDGGSIRELGGFPHQEAIELRISEGGVIDIRALDVADVTAAIAQGGIIFTRPGQRLDARVAQGGNITYWGRPALARSVRQGGVVQRGADSDFDRPMSEPGGPPPLPPIPPIPPLPNPG